MDKLDHTLGNQADWKHWTGEAARAAQQAESELARTIVAAREAGVTWQEIGDAIGCSKQAAWEKYRPQLDGPLRYSEL